MKALSYLRIPKVQKYSRGMANPMGVRYRSRIAIKSRSSAARLSGSSEACQRFGWTIARHEDVPYSLAARHAEHRRTTLEGQIETIAT
jgi:hypothetical protein